MTMNEPVDSSFTNTTNNLVGKAINRVDGPLKVSGQAPYSAEIYRDNQAYGVLVSAKIAKGHVESIDSSALDDIPGIIKVVTDPKHFLRNPQQGQQPKPPLKALARFFIMVSPLPLWSLKHLKQQQKALKQFV